MNFQPYNLVVQFPASNVNVTKRFKEDKSAFHWAQLCLDICGKDEHGKGFIHAALFDERGNLVRAWDQIR